MSATNESIASNIEALANDGYTVKIQTASQIYDGKRHYFYCVTVHREYDEIVATGESGLLSEAIKDAYGATPETER